MKFAKDFRGVPAGEIYPVEYRKGEECPPELEAGATALGALEIKPAGGPKPPAPVPLPPLPAPSPSPVPDTGAGAVDGAGAGGELPADTKAAGKPSDGLTVEKLREALAAKQIAIPDGVTKKAELADLLDNPPAA